MLDIPGLDDQSAVPLLFHFLSEAHDIYNTPDRPTNDHSFSRIEACLVVLTKMQLTSKQMIVVQTRIGEFMNDLFIHERNQAAYSAYEDALSAIVAREKVYPFLEAYTASVMAIISAYVDAEAKPSEVQRTRVIMQSRLSLMTDLLCAVDEPVHDVERILDWIDEREHLEFSNIGGQLIEASEFRRRSFKFAAVAK